MSELRATTGAALPELSVVLPTRNEAGNIEPLLARLRGALQDVAFELVFIDDSDDQTAALLATAASLDPQVRIVHRTPELREGGLSTAVVLGLHEARGRLVCVMDADLQHPPETIPAMLVTEREGADLVVASRYLPGGSREGLATGMRQFVSLAASLLVRAVFVEARASTDPLAGFFLCRSSLLRGVEFRPVGFKILLELLVCSSHPRVGEVPLQFQARTAGESKASFAQGLLFLRHLWSLIRDVPGSARVWKFAAVGTSGLLLFLLVLELCGNVLGWPALSAWSVAFVLSVVWNFSWNLRLTFADLRRERYPLMRRYVASTLTAGGAQLAMFLGLVGTSLPLVLDGLLAAMVGMGVNAALNWQLARRHRRPSPSPVGVDQFLTRLGRVGRAQLTALLDRDGHEVAHWGRPAVAVTELLGSLAERASRSGVPVLWTEPLSNRPQARTNVELASIMVLPLELPGSDGFTVALERHTRTAFSSADLEAAMRQLARMRPQLALGAIAGANDPVPAGGSQFTAELSGSRERTGPGTASRLS
ncbi:MAG TPA: glycosyltransferase family 2 protein [Candidatus Dormibacteraeota bacterium]|nr:glycosyltransferase family 2 protein [Candidatus Dormibacteraeota bacterium]